MIPVNQISPQLFKELYDGNIVIVHGSEGTGKTRLLNSLLSTKSIIDASSALSFSEINHFIIESNCPGIGIDNAHDMDITTLLKTAESSINKKKGLVICLEDKEKLEINKINQLAISLDKQIIYVQLCLRSVPIPPPLLTL